MESKTQPNVRDRLIEKWPKISKNEADDIVAHHDHLRSSLKKHYKMNEVDAKRQEVEFFKSQDKSKTGTHG